MLNKIGHFLPLLGFISPIIGIMTFFIGRKLGKRDAYRNERNKAAEPVYIGVLSHIKELSQRINTRIPVTQKQVDKLCWHSNNTDAEKIQAAWKEYKTVELMAGGEHSPDPGFTDYDYFVDVAKKFAKLVEKK